MRRVAAVMENGLLRSADLAVDAKVMPGVLIPVVTRKVARRNFEPYAMPRLEDVARRPKIDLVLVNAVGRDERGRGLRLPEPRANYAADDILRVPVGPHVDQLGGETGVGARGPPLNPQRYRCPDLQIAGQH